MMSSADGFFFFFFFFLQENKSVMSSFSGLLVSTAFTALTNPRGHVGETVAGGGNQGDQGKMALKDTTVSPGCGILRIHALK